ncbi:hypothetical protein [Ancylobacter lacus]|uniref:hypothetical protein n=1 Tax=Ancylobacter lacus TaxID=2579970 RepID=UPI001BCFA74D|nr:hypothetical protein [Ancylobacter lacus]MBS7538877.1 hypothetical protein [Ancylobacter lacus]
MDGTSHRRFFSPAAGALALALAGLVAAGPAGAADLSNPAAIPVKADPAAAAAPASDWRFQLTLYGWLTGLNGDIGVRDRPTVPLDASISDVLKNLDGAVMGSFLAQNSQWLFIADLVLAQLSHDDTFGRRGELNADATLTQTIATGAVGYKLPIGVANLDLAVTAGLRYVQLSTDLDVTLSGHDFAWSRSDSEQWVDPTVGFVLQWAITDRWYLNAMADIGGFGVGSQLSSTGYVGVGYLWTTSISTAIGYRYLYEDYENGGFRYNATMHGPTVNLGWRF